MRGTEKSATAPGEAVTALVFEVAATFFRLKAAGKRVGAVTPSGAGILGLLRSLAREGPQTVPQLARSRPVARQHIQRMANDAEAEGLLEFFDNPAHRKSQLLRLTPRGEQTYAELMERLLALGDELAQGMDPADIEHATAVLRRLRAKLAEA